MGCKTCNPPRIFYVGGTPTWTIWGTDENDHFIAADGGSVFHGKGGNDLIEGHNFDYLRGGAGNDIVTAGVRNELGLSIGERFLSGGAGSDIVLGGSENETLLGDVEIRSLYPDLYFFNIDHFTYRTAGVNTTIQPGLRP